MIEALDAIGVFVFALSGAALATRNDMDIIGAVSLALVTGLAGGVLRDILVGDLPPVAFVKPFYLVIPVIAALTVVLIPRFPDTLRRPVILFDAAGLALFAVVGAAKATSAGLGPVAATVIGALSAAGGGVIRDVIVNDVPTICTPHSELYVIPASAGALAVAIATRQLSETSTITPSIVSVAAAAAIFVVRLASVRFGWTTPALRSGGQATG